MISRLLIVKGIFFSDMKSGKRSDRLHEYRVSEIFELNPNKNHKL